MFYKDEPVLVTGGSGFVGIHVVKALLEAGARVRVPIHKRPLELDHDNIERVEANLTVQDQCVRAMDGIKYVFHCAGAVSAAGVTANNPMSPITENLTLTTNVLQAAWTTKVERIQVFGSSTAYPVADHPIREDELWDGPTHPAYFGYGWMRRYIERLAEFVHERSETRVALVRPTAIYGRHDDFDPLTSHVIPALIRKAVEKMNPYEVWGTGDEVRDFLHVEDLAHGVLLMLEKHAECDPVNIGLGGVITVREIVLMILKAAGHEDAEIVFNSDRPTTIPFRAVDTSKARRILGFEPSYNLADGMNDTVQWYMSQRAME